MRFIPFFKKRRRSRRSRLRRIFGWSIRLGLFLIALDIAYLWHIWPDWRQFQHNNPPKSQFIRHYEAQRHNNKNLPALEWRPVPMSSIPAHVRHAILIAEDARFYQHSGVDIQAVKEAIDYNIEKGRIKYGASTLSQQTVKNMFFSASRNPLRKWHELILTLAMERNLSKRRIFFTYLNVAEFGKGIYGVQAAARHYWNHSITRLTPWQAAQLAATLPSPRKHNPARPTTTFMKRARRIFHRLQPFIKREP